jgi:hypothetical protein
MLPWPIKRHAFICSFSVTSLRQILSRWVHPCLVVGSNTSSHGKNRCNLIKHLHNILAPCNPCLFVVLGKTNRRFIFYWLMSCPNCNLILNCVGSTWCLSSQDCKMGNALSIEIGPRIRLPHSSQWMVYYSRYATERKDVMLGVSLLRLVKFEP